MAQQQMPRELPDLVIEDLEFVYNTNFAGARERYNEEGNRYFNAKINPQIAEALASDGWNIKWTKPGENHPNPEEFVSEPYVVVTVGYKFRPPLIALIREVDGKEHVTPVTESTVALLDSMEFSNIDVAIRGVYWENSQGRGYKAWLKSMYATVKMDDLDRKYAHLMSVSSSSDAANAMEASV